MITPQTGLVANNLDVHDAYLKIQSIKKNGKSYYSNACINLARERYDKEKCFEEYVKLYEDLVQMS